MIQTSHWSEQSLEAQAVGVSVRSCACMCPGPVPVSKYNGGIQATVTDAAGPHLRQRASQVQNRIHMLFMPYAERGCEGLGRCHTTRMRSSTLTRLKSNEMGLFILAQEVKW